MNNSQVNERASAIHRAPPLPRRPALFALPTPIWALFLTLLYQKKRVCRANAAARHHHLLSHMRESNFLILIILKRTLVWNFHYWQLPVMLDNLTIKCCGCPRNLQKKPTCLVYGQVEKFHNFVAMDGSCPAWIMPGARGPASFPVSQPLAPPTSSGYGFLWSKKDLHQDRGCAWREAYRGRGDWWHNESFC